MNFPEEYLDLLTDETKAYAYLATLMADGTPQVTPVWFNTDEDHILVNTAVGRTKDRNMKARPHVALCIADPKNPYRYVQVRGKVVEHTTEGANEHIDSLAWKYRGIKKYDNYQPGMQRIIYKILPENIDEH
ncbi:MAG: PPOX class F420-dependent oxidoreductase [Chloroflexota bacterium]